MKKELVKKFKERTSMISGLTYGLTAGESRMVGSLKIVIIAMKSI